MLRATPSEGQFSAECSYISLAAVMLRATPSEGQFSAESHQASQKNKNQQTRHVFQISPIFVRVLGGVAVGVVTHCAK